LKIIGTITAPGGGYEHVTAGAPAYPDARAVLERLIREGQ